MKRPAKAKTHFVPTVVFRTAFVGVVPICVAGTACGDSPSGGGGDAAVSPTVACAAFGCGVGVQAFTDASDGPLLSVACLGFDGQPCGVVPTDAAAQDHSNAADGDAANQGCPGQCPPGPGGACFCGVGFIAFVDGGDSG